MRSVLREAGRLVLAGALGAIWGCGQSEPQPPSQFPAGASAVPGMPQATAMPMAPGWTGMPPGMPGATAMPMAPGVGQNPLAMLGALGQAMGQAMAGAQAMANAPAAGGPLVNWRDLATALPAAVPGWEPRGDVEGSTGAMGAMGGSSAQRRFHQGNRDVKFEVIDTSFNQLLVLPFNMARAVAVDSSSEMQRASDVSGQPGFLKYTFGNRRSEQTVLAHARFIVSVEVESAQAPQEAVALAALVDYVRLSGLAAAAAQAAAAAAATAMPAPATAAP